MITSKKCLISYIRKELKKYGWKLFVYNKEFTKNSIVGCCDKNKKNIKITNNQKIEDFALVLFHEFYHFIQSFQNNYKSLIAYEKYFDIVDNSIGKKLSLDSMKEVLKEEYDADCYAINEMNKLKLNTKEYYKFANAYVLKIKYICQTGKNYNDYSQNLINLTSDNRLTRKELFKPLSKLMINKINKLSKE